MLLLDAGNSLIYDREPALFSQGGTSIELMNMMGYHAVALGEKDLHLGEETLRQRIAEAGFAFLSANVYVRGQSQPFTKAYTFVDALDHRIGIIGITGSPTAEDNDSPFEVRDPIAALESVLSEIGQQADYLILLSNATLPTNREMLNRFPEIDLILRGGPGEILMEPEEGPAGNLLFQADYATPGHAGRQVGIFTIAIDQEGRRITHTWQSLSLVPEVGDDPDMFAWITSL